MTAEMGQGKTPSAALFDEAETTAYFSLRYDVFPRFVASPLYAQLVEHKLSQLRSVGKCVRAR